MTMADTRKRSFVLSLKQLSYLEKEAKRLGITASDLLRRIIDEYRKLQAVLYPSKGVRPKNTMVSWQNDPRTAASFPTKKWLEDYLSRNPGWIEPKGQTMSKKDYPALFDAVKKDK